MVRIHEDFWDNYYANEELIRKATIDITRKQFKWPGKDGFKEAHNHVITELHRLLIFEKWNQERLTSKTRTTQQQYENFIYQRIWAILFGAYTKRKNIKKREKRSKYFETEIHPDVWRTPEFFFNDEDELCTIKKEKREKEEQLREYRAKRAPTIKDLYPPYPKSDYLAECNSAYETILDACRNQREKDIVKAKLNGMTNKDIATKEKLTSLYVKNILKGIKERYSRLETA